MSNFRTNQSLGEIVAIMPKASEVLKEYRIDFCCGGHRALSEAIKEQGLDEAKIMKRPDDVYEDTKKLTNQTDFRTLSSSELIDYVVTTHHSFTRQILPEISELTTTIMRVHGVNHKELFQVHKLFHNLKMELEQHLIKEEEILFPMIKEYDREPSDDLLNKINETVKETESEHTAAGDILKELRKVTNEYELPLDACRTFEKAYETIRELEADLFQHIHLENNILFQRLGIIIHE